MTDSVDPDQTASIGAVCSGSTLFASIFNSSVMLGNYLQQTTSADDIFDFFLGALRVKAWRLATVHMHHMTLPSPLSDVEHHHAWHEADRMLSDQPDETKQKMCVSDRLQLHEVS